MQMWNMDVYNCVATGGKKVSQNQIEILTRLCVDICFVFDKDVQLSELMVLANRFVEGFWMKRKPRLIILKNLRH